MFRAILAALFVGLLEQNLAGFHEDRFIKPKQTVAIDRERQSA